MSDPALRARAHALLERVLDLDPVERDAVLREAGEADPELMAHVYALLEADAATHTLLDGDAQRLIGLLHDDEEGLPYDGRIGAYRLIARAGRGGMATVFLAERAVGDVRQRVALKLVNRGTDTDEVLRRFAHETRVLASLEHPNIARFHDVGVSPDGRPYLVMEYIEGVPLTSYCDGARLGIEARIALFRTVCDAVQYAHQHLVVHRDIKPSNILVTERGEVKLLDFGIAKLLSEEPELAAPRTRTGMLVLTPEYAAPEQLLGHSISTTTDVYALGLVLYELLAGMRARDGTARAGAGDVHVDRFEPQSPSAAVRRVARSASAGTIATARGTSLERLRRRLDGDLDRIVLKALEPEPTLRYQSAQQLNDDLERHRRGLPVHARPATLHYRLRKYARRHRAALAATAVMVVVLAAFAGFHTVRITRERDRAQAAAERSQATTQFLVRLLGDAYPSTALGDSFSMSALLSRAVMRADSLAEQPIVQGELLRTIGDVYREQGHFDQALPLLERAVAAHRRTGELRTQEAGHALSALGHLYYERHDYEAAWQTHRESLDIYEQIEADTLVLYALNNMAAAATQLEKYDDALRLYQDVLERRRGLFADTSQLVHTAHNNLGQLHHERGDYVDAEREHREALRIRRAGLPADHPSIALSLNNLATTLTSTGRLDEAESVHREALAIFQRVFGPHHHRVGLSAYNLARVLQKKGELDEAESLFRITLDIDRRTYGANHLEVGTDLGALGRLQREKGDCSTAVATLREAESIFAGNGLPLAHRRRLNARGDIGACLTALGRFGEAEEVLLGGYNATRTADAPVDSAALRVTLERLTELYQTWGRPTEAETFRALLTPK